MRQERAKRIMRLMGWGPSETARQFNRVTGRRYTRQHVNTQVNSERGVSEALAVFLRLAVRIAVLERRSGRRCLSERAARAIRRRRDAGKEPPDVERTIR